MAFGPEMEILLKVVIAAALGGVIGFERELLRKPAGLRTHTLVATAAALLVSISDLLVEEFVQRFGEANAATIRADPLSIIQAIVVGISFLGAGVIIEKKGEGDVRNLTTAAAILLVAAIGITVALEAYYLAVGVTILGLIINQGLGKIEERVLQKPVQKIKQQ